MNQEIKALWVADLRKNGDLQGMGALRTLPQMDGSSKFCCLGRLCELAVAAGVIPEPVPSLTCMSYGTEDASTMYLPDSVKRWAETGLGSGSVTIDGVLQSLSVHNDKGKTFEQIADAIEREL